METNKFFSQEEIESPKKDFNNPVKLKCILEDTFTNRTDLSVFRIEYILAIKDGYEIQDETIRSVLGDIYRESAQKTSWKIMVDWDAECLLYGSIRWMRVFADEPTKKLLLDIATDIQKDIFYRYPAILSYIYCANAQEVRDLFAWLLGDEKRFSINLRATLMEQIRPLWCEIEADTQKREAVVASLSVAVAQEKDKRTFEGLDDFLVQNSKGYAESPQRKIAIQRINKLSENEPVGNKTPPWKLPLLVGTIIFGGVVVAWCYLKRWRN
jgi:hypothetical protein